MAVRAAVDRYDKKLSRLLEPCLKISWLVIVMRAVSVFASGYVCLPIYAGLVFLYHPAASLVTTIIIGECLQLPVIIILRRLTRRPRPDVVARGDDFFAWNRYSFPSLHSARAFMLGGIICRLYHAVTLPVMIAVLLIALSRLILQKHYLSDILCGAIIGVFSAWGSLFWQY